MSGVFPGGGCLRFDLTGTKVVERVQIDPGANSKAAFLSITSAVSTRVLQRWNCRQASLVQSCINLWCVPGCTSPAQNVFWPHELVWTHPSMLACVLLQFPVDLVAGHLAFSSPEPTILLACGRDRELWSDPIFWVCAEHSFRILDQSDLMGSPWIADFRC